MSNGAVDSVASPPDPCYFSHTAASFDRTTFAGDCPHPCRADHSKCVESLGVVDVMLGSTPCRFAAVLCAWTGVWNACGKRVAVLAGGSGTRVHTALCSSPRQVSALCKPRGCGCSRGSRVCTSRNTRGDVSRSPYRCRWGFSCHRCRRHQRRRPRWCQSQCRCRRQRQCHHRRLCRWWCQCQ